MNTIQDKGGQQGKDPSYNPQTHIPQPPRPSYSTPSIHDYQQPQSYGEASSYYDGFPQSPFPPAPTAHSQSAAPPAHGYSPPLVGYSPHNTQNMGTQTVHRYGAETSSYGGPYNTTSAPVSYGAPAPVNESYQEHSTGYNSSPPAPQGVAQYYPEPGPPAQPTYDSSVAPIQRSHTEPAIRMKHSCGEHWNL